LNVERVLLQATGSFDSLLVGQIRLGDRLTAARYFFLPAILLVRFGGQAVKRLGEQLLSLAKCNKP
jgi:hypothetical protein